MHLRIDLAGILVPLCTVILCVLVRHCAMWKSDVSNCKDYYCSTVMRCRANDVLENQIELKIQRACEGVISDNRNQRVVLHSGDARLHSAHGAICVNVPRQPRRYISALKPYWGKPTVRNFRGGYGNGGIIRSPLSAIA
jgi:hypothetical protein